MRHAHARVRRNVERTGGVAFPAVRVARRMGCTFDGVRAALFDLDNTLVDVLRVKDAAVRAATRAAGLAPGHLSAVAFEIGIDRDDVVDVALARLGVRDPARAARGRRAWAQAEAHAARPYPRAARTLAALRARGYALALVTDAPRRKAEQRLAASGLARYFPLVVAREDTPEGKADGRPFALALAALGTRPDEAVVVGDNPRRDVGSGRAAGCRTVLARYGLQESFASDAPEHRADADVARVDALLDILPFDAASDGRGIA